MTLSISEGFFRPQTAHLHTAYALRTNAEEFVKFYGIDFCAFGTLTLQDRLYPIPATRKLTRALGIFPEYFDDWLWTFGLGQDRRIHFHTLSITRENIRQGIDLSLYPLLLDHDDAIILPGVPLTRAEIRRRLSSNAALLHLRRDLYPRLHKIGFGHQLDLSPILSNGRAIAAYLERNYLDTVRRRNVLFKGVRLTGYKPGGHRVCRPPFARADRRRRRHAIKIVAQALGVSQYENMKSIFGPKWGYLSNIILLDLESRHGRDPDGWSPAMIRQLAIDEGMMPPLAAA